MTSPISPTQLAYDRIQRAACRSPMDIGNIRLTYELRKEGILISGRAPTKTGVNWKHAHRLVTWSAMATCKDDPLAIEHRRLFVELLNPKEPEENANW